MADKSDDDDDICCILPLLLGAIKAPAVEARRVRRRQFIVATYCRVCLMAAIQMIARALCMLSSSSAAGA